MAGANSGNNNSNNINSDPFEEFEFRPINEGLGFHRKQKNQQTATPAKPTSTSMPSMAATKNAVNLATTYATINSTTNSTSNNPTSVSSFQSPLPRPETRKATSFQVPTIEDDSIAKAQTAVNEILKNLNHKRQLDFVQESTRLKGEYKKSKPHFFAATLDAMLITAAFLMSMILMLSITKVDLFMNLTHPNTSGLVYFSTAALFFSVTFIYMVVNRTFMGATPGEWAFEQICGQPQQAQSLSYVPRIALRTLSVMFTGFIILPILSYLFNKDVAGEISGVALLKKPNV